MRLSRSYSSLAAHYDDVVGLNQFALNRHNFEQFAVRRLRQLTKTADLACGTGLFAEYLGRCWRVPVLAVDRSPEMLTIARRRCRGLDVKFLCQDLCSFQLPSSVDLITLNSFTFNQLARELSGVLDAIARHLRRDDLFLFDVLTSRHRIERRSTASVTAFPIRKSRQSICLDVTIHPWRRQTTHELHCARLFEPQELPRLLRRHGLTLDEMRDAQTLEPVHGSSPAVICIAKPSRRFCG